MNANAAVDVLIIDREGCLADVVAGVVHNRFPQSRVVTRATAAEAAACVARDWFRVFLCLEAPDAQSQALLQKLHGLGLAQRTCVATRHEAWGALPEPFGLGVLGRVDARLPAYEFVAELRRFVCTGTSATAPLRLSAPQTRVLRLLHRGFSSKQIAGELHIAEGTARNHTSALLRALGARNRTHAVARGIELGLICAAPARTART